MEITLGQQYNVGDHGLDFFTSASVRTQSINQNDFVLMLTSPVYYITHFNSYNYKYHIVVCVCVFIKLHITTQPGPVILAILCYSQ